MSRYPNPARPLLGVLFLFLTTVQIVSGFSPQIVSRRSSTKLFATVSVRTPSQEEAEGLGIREWPQQAKSKGAFQEVCQDTLVRYVLDGQGSVQVTDGEESKQVAMAPGSLLEVSGEATLDWVVASDEMIILTPGFEQGGLFAGVTLAVVVLLGALIATS